jgi:hypothetical protein
MNRCIGGSPPAIPIGRGALGPRHSQIRAATHRAAVEQAEAMLEE